MFSQQTYDGVEYRMIQTENFCAIKVFATMDYLKMGGAGKTYNYFFFLCFIGLNVPSNSYYYEDNIR